MGEILTVCSRLTAGMQFSAEAGSGHTVLLDATEHAGDRMTEAKCDVHVIGLLLQHAKAYDTLSVAPVE